MTRRSVRAAKRVDKSSAVVAPNVLRLTEPRSAKSSRPATISRDTGRLQVCSTGAASRLNTYKTPGYSQHVPPGQRNATTSSFFLAPRRRSGERAEEMGVLTERASSPPSGEHVFSAQLPSWLERGLQAASHSALSRGQGISQGPWDCPTRKRRKRRAPFACAPATLKRYSGVERETLLANPTSHLSRRLISRPL